MMRTSGWALSCVVGLVVGLGAAPEARAAKRKPTKPAAAVPAAPVRESIPSEPPTREPEPQPALQPKAPAPSRNLKPRLAIVGLDAPELRPETRAALEDLVGSVAASVSGLEVVTSRDLRAVLSLAELQQLSGCSDGACVDTLGSVLAVEQLLAGGARKAGDGYVLSLQHMDVVNNRVLGRVSETVPGDEQALLAQAQRLVPQLFGVIGRLVLWDQPPEAEVFVNGRLVGATPVGPVVVERAGPLTVRVEGPGILPWEKLVSLEPGADARVRVQSDSIVMLETEASLRKTFAWTATGLGALLTVAGGTLYGLALANDRRLDRIDPRTVSQDRLDAITTRSLTLLVGAVASGVLGLGTLGLGVYGHTNNPAADKLAAQGGSL